VAAPRTRFVCQSCGGATPRWAGRCGQCGEWHTLVEETATPAVRPQGAVAIAQGADATPRPITRVDGKDSRHIVTGIGELDRVLGGGVVPGAVMLVGGDPGIGKSTLMLQACACLARRGTVLYVSGEEAPHQVRLRAERLNAMSDSLLVLCETRLEAIERHIEATSPTALVVDSIQTTWTERLESAPGSVGQVREASARLIGIAKGRGIPAFLVGHVTKDGAIAGPRVLEHMVDTVLYFEGDRGHACRVLRAVKNRFGNTNEIGVFEMQAEGLMGISNPSAFFLAERPMGATGSVVTAAVTGTRPVLVEVQALVSPAPYGSARRTALGVDAGRLGLLLAVLEKRAGLAMGGEDVFANVVGGFRLDEPAADLAILLAVAGSFRDTPLSGDTLVVGEVGLAGEVRAVQQIETRIREAEGLGFTRFLIPERNAGRIQHPGAVGVSSVREAIDLAFQ